MTGKAFSHGFGKCLATFNVLDRLGEITRVYSCEKNTLFTSV